MTTGPLGPLGPPRLELVEGVSLAERTTLGLGGPARWWCAVEGLDDLRAAREWAARADVPVLVVGGGSNLVVADKGFDGLVVELRDASRIVESAEATSSPGDVLVRVGAAHDWDALVAWAVEEGLEGLEGLSGIPGRVGAAPIQNIGAYGQEVAEVVEAVEAFDLEAGEARRLEKDECGFGYRTSRFKHRDAGRWIVVGVEMRLHRSVTGTVKYRELQRRLGVAEGGGAPLTEIRDAVLDLRRGKSMVVDPGDPESRSVGSFFVNPVVAPEKLDELRGQVSRDVPSWPTADGGAKLSAAWLIESAGFRKGEDWGEGSAGIGISKRHALALVHRGGGSSAELVRRAAEIRGRVLERFGVALEPEPVFVGFGPPRSGRRGLGWNGAEVLNDVLGHPSEIG